MATVTKPVALDESLNTTENTPRNIADVLADELSNIADKIQGGGSGECARKADLTNLDLTGTTNTTGSTIASGTYFYLNGTLVRAKTAIASGETFTLNTNYKVVTVGDALSGLIKKRSYNFTSFTENCMVTDLSVVASAVIGIRVKNRYGWNLIARNGVSGSVSPNVWVIVDPAGGTLSGTFEIDVYYLQLS